MLICYTISYKNYIIHTCEVEEQFSIPKKFLKKSLFVFYFIVFQTIKLSKIFIVVFSTPNLPIDIGKIYGLTKKVIRHFFILIN
jgi:hypothetical protein